MTIPLLILFGPTASGKTKLATELAKHFESEIISADSMAIYRGMDIGTAKPSAEERCTPYHLIDICDPWESYSVGMFIEDAAATIAAIHQRGKTVLMVGGTALYVKGLLEGIFDGPPANWALRNSLAKEYPQELYQRLCQIDPVSAQKISCHDLRRIIRGLEVFYSTGKPISLWQKQCTNPPALYAPCFIGLAWERQALYDRIEQRVDQMIQNGLIAETQRLLALPYPLSHTASQAIGYKETIAALHDSSLMNDLIPKIKQNTRRFAKRQLTWLKRFPIHWISANSQTNFDDIVISAKQIWEVHDQDTKLAPPNPL